MQYSRASTFHVSSLALWQYNKDIGDLNDFYWSSRFAFDITARQAKAHPGVDGPELLRQLSTTSTASTHVGHTSDELSKRQKMADRWLRLSALVLASSAFERYLVTVATAAVESDPLLAAGWPKRVDGLTLRKHGLTAPSHNLDGIVKGAWSRRLASYKDLFGAVPPRFREEERELEKLRKMRNKVAHEFGSDSHPSVMPSAALMLSIRRRARENATGVTISEERLVNALRSFDRAANAIDEHLLKEHIGAYEITALYAEWKRDPNAFEGQLGVVLNGSKRSHGERFTSAVGNFLPPLGKQYVQGMEAFLRSL